MERASRVRRVALRGSGDGIVAAFVRPRPGLRSVEAGGGPAFAVPRGPVPFTAAARPGAMPERRAIPAVATLAYHHPGPCRGAHGPAAIGFAAHAAGLATAFPVIAVMLGGRRRGRAPDRGQNGLMGKNRR